MPRLSKAVGIHVLGKREGFSLGTAGALRRRFARQFLYKQARRIHTVSHGLRESLISEGFDGRRIEVIVNGVDSERFKPGVKPEARKTCGLPEEGLLIGLVGRFGAYKRHLDLIEAFEGVAGRQADARLVMIGGGGPMEGAVRERALRSAVAERIHLAGLQENPAPWYQALDLLVMPSTNEGVWSTVRGSPAASEAANGAPVSTSAA